MKMLCIKSYVSPASYFLVLCSVGANEANLIHVHAAVYALFLCLYGMYPCYFMKYLQQYFQSGSKGSFVKVFFYG